MADLMAIVLKKGGPVALDEMAEVLGRLRGWNREEAVQHLLLCPGIILRDATTAELEVLGEALKRTKTPYLVLPTPKLPHLHLIPTHDLTVTEECVVGRGGEETIRKEEFLIAVGGWLDESRFLIAVVSRDGRVLFCDWNVHRDGEKIVETARKLLKYHPVNRVSYALHRVAKEEVAVAKTEAVTFPDEGAFRSYVMWLVTLTACAEQTVSQKRRPYISRLGRVRFRWGNKLLDWDGQRRLEEAAARMYARPVVAERPTPRSARHLSANRLPLNVGLDVAMLLEQGALVRVAIASAVVAAIMWLILVIIRCCR